MTTETATTEAASPATATETPADPLFNKQELQQFEADDREAGQAIGKMLSTFFLYTIIVMSLAAWWTWRSLN